MQGFTNNEKELVRYLRDEAMKVKDCFSQYSFQSMAFSGAFFILITSLQREHPLVGVSSFLVVVLVLAVARIGTHKYATANRNYGFQLYLERICRLKHKSHDSRKDFLRNIGWEEAMRAWRIVQATTFNTLYNSGFWKINRLKKEYSNMQYKWFEPKALLVNGSSWHAGSYLGNMLVVLHSIAFLSLIPLVVTCIQEYETKNYKIFILLLIFTIFATYLILFRISKTRARRIILEEGLLCIHSCSIMWHAVIVAYCRAIIALQCDDSCKVDSYKDLTKYLSIFAIDLNENIEKIHSWIEYDDRTYAIEVIERYKK